MAAGLQFSKDYINQKVGAVALQVRQILDTADHLTRTLSPYDQAGLEALGYPAQDATDMLDGLYSLSLLVNVAYGNDALPTAVDMRVGLAKVTGID